MADRRPLQALTILQPWAHLIAHGPKRIENRTWAPPASLVGGYLAIHAGKRVDPSSWDGADDMALIAFGLTRAPWPKVLQDRDADDARAGREYMRAAVPYGAVVAVARLVDVVSESADAWFCGPCGWVLADVVALPTPVPCSGAQGLWTPPPDVLELVRARYKAATQAAATGCAP